MKCLDYVGVYLKKKQTNKQTHKSFIRHDGGSIFFYPNWFVYHEKVVYVGWEYLDSKYPL